jgi:hypothetical protein
MEQISGLVSLTAPEFAAVIALFLPGFVSLKVDRLIQPASPMNVGEMVLEAFAYSLINAGLLSWAILQASQAISRNPPEYVSVATYAALICVVGPTIWPVAFRFLQRWGARQGLMLGQERFAFDFAFRGRRARWVIVHLSDGRLVGGYFGLNSYATVEPQTGHLYIEELWNLDDRGRFLSAIPGSRGAIFRPTDYVWIEMFHDGVQPEGDVAV